MQMITKSPDTDIEIPADMLRVDMIVDIICSNPDIYLQSYILDIVMDSDNSTKASVQWRTAF